VYKNVIFVMGQNGRDVAIDAATLCVVKAFEMPQRKYLRSNASQSVLLESGLLVCWSSRDCYSFWDRGTRPPPNTLRGCCSALQVLDVKGLTKNRFYKVDCKKKEERR
jgi:hypothetical protein